MIFASGLKYAGVGTTALGWILCVTLLAAAVFCLAYVRPWRAGLDTLPDARGVLTEPPDDGSRAAGQVGPGRVPSDLE